MFNATAQLLMEYYLPMILIIFMFTLSQIKTRGFLRSLVKFLERIWLFRRRIAVTLLSGVTLTVVTAAQAFAQTPECGGRRGQSEASGPITSPVPGLRWAHPAYFWDYILRLRTAFWAGDLSTS